MWKIFFMVQSSFHAQKVWTIHGPIDDVCGGSCVDAQQISRTPPTVGNLLGDHHCWNFPMTRMSWSGNLSWVVVRVIIVAGARFVMNEQGWKGKMWLTEQNCKKYHCSMTVLTTWWEHGQWSLTKLHVWEARLSHGPLLAFQGHDFVSNPILNSLRWHFFRHEEYPSLGSLSLWPTQHLFAFTFSTILETNSQSHKHSSSCWLKSSSCPPSCCCCCLSLSCSCSNWCRCSYYHYDDHHCPSPLFPPYCNKVWPHTFAIIGDNDIES